MSSRIIRLSELATTPKKDGMIPVSPATIWRWVKTGKFPAPFKLSESITVWNLDDIEAFVFRRQNGDAK